MTVQILLTAAFALSIIASIISFWRNDIGTALYFLLLGILFQLQKMGGS